MHVGVSGSSMIVRDSSAPALAFLRGRLMLGSTVSCPQRFAARLCPVFLIIECDGLSVRFVIRGVRGVLWLLIAG